MRKSGHHLLFLLDVVDPRSVQFVSRFSFAGTNPRHQRRGAASLSMRWGLEHGERSHISAYLESTVQARPIHEGHGFRDVHNLSVVLKEMMGDNAGLVYEETCFLFRLRFKMLYKQYLRRSETK